MIGDILQPTHLLFILVIALLVLGPKRLPEVGRALGRGLRDFRNAINSDELRDQVISPTGFENPQAVEQPRGAAPEAAVSQPADQPPATRDPSASIASTDESTSSTEEASHSSELTAAAPTLERAP